MTLTPTSTPFDRQVLTSLHLGYRDRGRPDLTLYGSLTDVFIDALNAPTEVAAELLDVKARQHPIAGRQVTLCRKVARRLLEPDLWQRLTPPAHLPRLGYLAIALADLIQKLLLKPAESIEPTDRLTQLAGWTYGTGLALRVAAPARATDLLREWRESLTSRCQTPSGRQ